jgi:hypothetical protein
MNRGEQLLDRLQSASAILALIGQSEDVSRLQRVAVREKNGS